MYINKDEEFVHLFADKSKFDTKEIQDHLSASKITLFDYNEFYDRLRNKNVDETLKDYLLVADNGSANQLLFKLINDNNEKDKFKIIDQDAIEHTKNIKSEREIQGLRDCNIRDGAALVKYFAWLENELIVNNRTNLNEYEAAVKSREFRAQGDLFMGESFDAISSTGANAAIIHYKPDENKSSNIDKNSVYLVDSGGQYM